LCTGRGKLQRKHQVIARFLPIRIATEVIAGDAWRIAAAS
jgi:hypothetical protein